MAEIRRVTDPKMGPLDGVSLDTKGVFTRFSTNENGERGIEDQYQHDVIIRASYETGTASVTIRELDVMVTVRIDELMEILAAAASAASEQLARQKGEQAQ